MCRGISLFIPTKLETLGLSSDRRTFHPHAYRKHPIHLWQALIDMGHLPVILWMSPGHESMVAWDGQITSGWGPPGEWRERYPLMMKSVFEPRSPDGSGIPVFFALDFDPADPRNGSSPGWNIYEPRAVHVQTGMRRFLRAGSQDLKEQSDILAHLLPIVRKDLTRRQSGPVEIQWYDELYEEHVSKSITILRAGDADKVVLARRIEARASMPFLVHDVLMRLSVRYPQCYLIAIATKGGVFISATPERLARVDNHALRTAALAGSIPAGTQAVAADELFSPKNLREHQVVVDAIRQSIAPVCLSVDVQERPSVLRLRNVSHLRSSISGQLLDGCTIADAVARLHPTPAVCGQPRDKALSIIRSLEHFHRGLYSGAVGWCDSYGTGEAAVAIRSAAIVDNEAVVYAGAGIMPDSVAKDELRETRAKARAILDAL
jgi:menaquinone-specific isochorismate synthase